MKVEEIVSKFKELHGILEIQPSEISITYLIAYCCRYLEVCKEVLFIYLSRKTFSSPWICYILIIAAQCLITLIHHSRLCAYFCFSFVAVVI